MIDHPVDRSIDDSTFGGYLKRHNRAPAFEGSDGEAYSAAIYVDPEPAEDGRYGACLLFVRWDASGSQPAGHLETEYLAWGASRKEATAALRTITLHAAKEHLERAIARRQEMPDW